MKNAESEQKRTLLVFAEDWGALPSSTQHLIKRVAETRRVVWVNSIGLRKPKLCLKDISRIIKKLSKFLFKKKIKINTTNSNIRVVNPLTIPVPTSRMGRWVASRLLKYQLDPYLKNELKNPILWSSLPTVSDLVDIIPVNATVYYCGDDFSGLSGVDHQYVSEHEVQLAAKSDLILVASEALKDKFPPEKTHVLSHGVDYHLFSSRREKANDFPDKKRPTVGFYGSISHWLDLDLLKFAFQSLPNWNFVFIGKSVVKLDELQSFPNVFFLGPKEHSELPRYSQHWDVAILPFLSNKQIESCNPLKLLEYMAAGKPVVSTRFPAMKKYEGLVQGVDTAEEFVTAIKMSRYLSNVSGLANAMRSMCRGEGWETKAEMLNKMLSNYD